MTKTISLVLALSLFINEYTFLYNAEILKNKYLTSNLVYLMGVCLILKRVNIFPRILWRKLPPICFLLEILLTLILLECSLVFLWQKVQDYLLNNADGLLIQLSEQPSLDWLICHLCCGKPNCSTLFADLLLRLASFCFLFAVCSFVS